MENGGIGQAIHKELRAEPRKLDELLSDHTEMQPLWPKLFAYAEFATAVGSPSISADKPFYIEEVPCPLGGKLRIAGLNTALLSFDNDDSPKNLASSHPISRSNKTGMMAT